jgi:hypothetical protein
MAHGCNTSYSGGGDQKDLSLKPAWQIVCETYLENTQCKKGLAERPNWKSTQGQTPITPKKKKRWY